MIHTMNETHWKICRQIQTQEMQRYSTEIILIGVRILRQLCSGITDAQLDPCRHSQEEVIHEVGVVRSAPLRQGTGADQHHRMLAVLSAT